MFNKFFIIFLFLAFFVRFIATMVGEGVKYMNDYTSTYKTIFMKDSTIILTGDSIRYIGRVDKFTFLYDKPLDKVIVINNDDIQKEEIQWKKD